MLPTSNFQHAMPWTAAVASVVAMAPAQAQTIHFNVPAQDAITGIPEFGRQADVQILVAQEVVSGKRTAAVVGSFSVAEALEKLLAGTELVVASSADGTYTLRPRMQRTSSVMLGDQQPAPAGGASVRMEDAGSQLEEVIVTAQKRSERLQDVPISITAMEAQQLEALRVQGVEDFAFSVPNLTYTQTGTTYPRIVLRGVNSRSGWFSPIAITVDGASYSAVDMTSILTSRVFDIERIEVLRGPQGALTGASALGGVLNIVTAKPDTDAFELTGTLDYSRFNTMLSKAVVNIPAGDTLAFRTVVYTESSDGAVKNVGPAGGSSSSDHYGGRVSASWRPTERFSLEGSFSYEQLRYGLTNGVYIDRHYGPAGSGAAARAQLESLGGIYFDDSVSFIDDVGNNGGTVKLDDRDHANITNLIGSLHGTYDMGGTTVDLIYGHYENSSDVSQDLDRSEFAVERANFFTTNRADSFELRFSSQWDGPINWVAGATYINDELPYRDYASAGAGDYAGSYDTILYTFTQARSVESKAMFANVFWDIMPRLHLSAGARYTELDSSAGYSISANGSAEFPTVAPYEDTLQSVDPRVALSFDIGGDAMIYAQYATGFRPGYANNPLVVGAQQTDRGPFDVPATVENEEMENYEVGIKATAWDRKLSFALSAFYMDYTNIQAFGGMLLDTGLADPYFDINVGSANAKGLELETVALAAEGWELRAGVGYVDTELDDGGSTQKIPGVRPWTSNLVSTYERPIVDGYTGQFRAEYTWQGRAFSQASETPASELPKFGVVNLSAGISTDRWNLVAYMENVTDEMYWISVTSGTSLRGSRAIFIPRTFGVRFNYTLRADR